MTPDDKARHSLVLPPRRESSASRKISLFRAWPQYSALPGSRAASSALQTRRWPRDVHRSSFSRRCHARHCRYGARHFMLGGHYRFFRALVMIRVYTCRAYIAGFRGPSSSASPAAEENAAVPRRIPLWRRAAPPLSFIVIASFILS